eukprot:TRINITY_DN12032_c0_g2_i1.p1 TRINITY_DN12032_c0_g2~~TRINITY_DN12032_c0_g2_i1.p1  ORF type:complete len:330 (+),score=73.43 TRINITY_DN12032_c0_g2_i1:46-1035(+)
MDIKDIASHSEAALQAIREYSLQTHLLRSFALQAAVGNESNNTNIFLKMESEQVTNSFKCRGALYKVLKCKERGVPLLTTASTGNHALASAYAMSCFGLKGKIFLPTTTLKAKVNMIQRRCPPGIELEFHGTDCMQAELRARAAADELKAEFISPYNDKEVIIGQSTCGVEIWNQLPEKKVDYILMSVGGGGFISGVGSYLKTVYPDVKIIGCQPENDPAMMKCVEANKVIEIDGKDTLSDGTAGNVEAGSITLPYCKEVVDEWCLVSESEIASAMRWTLDNEHKLIEGSAAVAVASLLKDPTRYQGKTAVIIICGGNVNSEKLKKIIE